jgi:hypothetical protein
MTRTEITFWALAAIVILSAFAILAAIANPAKATDWDWSMSGDSYHSHQQKPRRKKTHTRRPYDNSYDRERVRGYRSVEEDDDLRICAAPVRGLGTQWVGPEGALEAAKKDWMERTRYDLGESYLDLKNAKDFVSRCGRVSIGEALGQSMMRCEIVARPCKGEFADTQTTGK